MATSRTPIMSSTAAENDGEFTIADWGLFFGVSLIWGSSFLLIAEALEGLTPGTVTLGRVGLGAITLWIIRAARPNQPRIEKEDRRQLMLLSLLWVGIPFTLFPLAQEHINSAVTGLLNGATPVFAGLVSALLLKVVPTGTQLVGIVVGFLGIVLISIGSAGGGSSELQGVLMVLAATLCYGFAINLAAPLQKKYGAIVTMSGVLGLATIWVLPFGLWTIDDNEWRVAPVLAIVVLGAVGTGLAYWIMSALVGRVGPIRASFITYLIPVVSLLLGVTIRNDEVRALAIVGAALTIGGALMASRRKS
ncbi:MAG: DMT family transporter [Acidimicrobiia bacterium]|nr:DMT family transporter [Acidimicrobiia bacterium]